MCRAMIENGEFDSSLCPLLDGLTPEEIVLHIEANPHIQTCMAAMSDNSSRAEERFDACVAELKKVKAERNAIGDLDRFPEY